MSLTWRTHAVRHSRHGLVVMRTADLQALSLEVDAVESHRLGGLVNGAELEESKVLVQIDLACENGVAGSLGQSGEMHLLVEELHHLFLADSERDVSHVQPPGLARNRGAHDGNSGLGSIGDNIRRNLSSRLHRFVLQRSDVLKTGRGHVPVQRGLPAA